MNKNTLFSFKKELKISHPILGIHYLNKPLKNSKHYKDTACTALARAFLKKETLVFDAKKYLQLCSGANYFLKLSKISNSEAIKIYTEKEHVFENKNICKQFLKSLPKFPEYLRNKHIVIKPFETQDIPQIITLLINSAQAGRIIGLVNYKEYKEIKIFPNQSTCLSFFAPLVAGFPHINFIDYYDRYYQGKINGKNIWPENKMIISLTLDQFNIALNNFNKSPQGTYKHSSIKVQKIDKFYK